MALVTPPAAGQSHWLLVTSFVDTVNVALADPAGMVTRGGIVAATVLSLDRVTTKPPVAAAEDSVTLPVTELPIRMSVGSTESVASAGEDDAGGDVTVQPVNLAAVGVAEPSPTSTVQSAGGANGSR